MGTYYYLCCKNCRISLNLGKKLAKEGGRLVVQGVYSDKERAWLNDKHAWDIIQAFFQQHEGHDLLFVNDDDFSQIQLYDYVEGDDLLEGET